MIAIEMSIIQRSSIQSSPIFLKAIISWASGDLTNTQILCLQCLEGLRYNPSFPHLAACLYFLAFCARDDSSTEYAEDVMDCLQSKCTTGSLQISSPWSLLESFDGTSESFIELADRSNDHNEASKATVSGADSNPSDGEEEEEEVEEESGYLLASAPPPAWYHQACNRLTAENYESLALFCLQMHLRELGLAFAIRAHQEYRRRESPDLCSDSCFTSSASLSSTSNSAVAAASPQPLPSLSLPLLQQLHLPFSDQPVAQPSPKHKVYSIDLSQLQHSTEDSSTQEVPQSPSEGAETVVRQRRTRGSILKTPPPSAPALLNLQGDGGGSNNSNHCSDLSPPAVTGDADDLSERPVRKRVRFSLSASHPPPEVEAAFGGRSNHQRLQDMASRRRHRTLCPDGADEDDDMDDVYDEEDVYDPSSSSLDRFMASLWLRSRHHHRGGRHRGPRLVGAGGVRWVVEAGAYMACLAALVALTCLFLALVVCVPLRVVGGGSGGEAVGATCDRLLEMFGLRALLAANAR